MDSAGIVGSAREKTSNLVDKFASNNFCIKYYHVNSMILWVFIYCLLTCFHFCKETCGHVAKF